MTTVPVTDTSWIHPTSPAAGLSNVRQAPLHPDSGWDEPASIQEDDGSYTIRMPVSGIERENLTIEIREEALVISGARTSGEGALPHGSFYRVFSLPASTNPDALRARMLGEELSIELPKRRAPRVGGFLID